jgi:hypothetical protein
MRDIKLPDNQFGRIKNPGPTSGPQEDLEAAAGKS